MPPHTLLNVNEIFSSIQGEGTRVGIPCTFVRLQGCKLRCVWCDTPYALDHREQHQMMSAQDVIDDVASRGLKFVEFTGGEPLEQEAVYPLMTELCNQGYTVAVETGGHVDISELDPRVICILDVKCPDSKMSSLNKLDNLDKVRPSAEVKFVIASREDYLFAKDIVAQYDLPRRVESVLFSCAFGKLEYETLVNWILEDRLQVRFQLQIHKYVWTPETRGV